MTYSPKGRSSPKPGDVVAVPGRIERVYDDDSIHVFRRPIDLASGEFAPWTPPELLAAYEELAHTAQRIFEEATPDLQAHMWEFQALDAALAVVREMWRSSKHPSARGQGGTA